jgi:hypothetical protein
MNQRQVLINEIKRAPNDIFQEVFDFYQFLKSKSNKKITDILIASESSLKKDWDKESEDEAWQDL